MSKHYNPPMSRFYFMDAAELRRLARGRWREILVAAGIPADALHGRRGRPCPRCGGRDRFSPMPDLEERGAVLCRQCHNQSSEPKCGDGISTLRWWLGVGTGEALRWLSAWLNVRPGSWSPVHRVVRSEPKPSTPRALFDAMAEVLRRNMRPDALEHVAGLLGLPSGALERLGVGWSPSHQATTWPMRDADGNVIGIRLRCPQTARKWAFTGSAAGLFFDPLAMSKRAPGGRLWVCEGPTDAAALLSVGLDAVGVPSAGGAVDLVVALARRVKPTEVVIVADADDAGQRGAERLRDALVIVAPVRIMNPPKGLKDSRAWVCSGCDREVIERVADVAPVHRVFFQGGAS